MIQRAKGAAAADARFADFSSNDFGRCNNNSSTNERFSEDIFLASKQLKTQVHNDTSYGVKEGTTCTYTYTCNAYPRLW